MAQVKPKKPIKQTFLP